MRRRSSPDLDAEAVVAAATGVAFDVGLHAVTLQAVADQLRAPLRAVLKVAPDEQALVAAVFSSIATADLAEVRRTLLATPSPVAQIASLLRTNADGLHVDHGAVWLESWSLGRRNAALGEAVLREEAAWQAFIAGIVRRGVKSGEFRAVDPEAVAAQIASLMNGINCYSVVGFSTDEGRMALLTAAVRGQLGSDLQFGSASVAADRG